MLSDQRQYEMTEWILREGKAYISEMAEHFAVSAETVRRDLNVICADGRIKKVHGGAVAVRPLMRDDSYEVRLEKRVREKREIGKRAARLIEDNDVIALDSGTTAEALAREIYHVKNLCVVTASISVASILSQKIQRGDFEGKVILLGGTVDPETHILRGGQTISMMKRYFIDKAFLGATSVSPAGIMMWNEDDGLFTATILSQARSAYLLAESEKLGERSFYLVAPLDAAELLITDNVYPISADMQTAIDAAGLVADIVTINGIVKKDGDTLS
ncbi:MAG: DeoR/GlpR transcriptional regulator [Clostridia bacterium]|nr:DeoR/GlpR transcriptional regulator [Clostridia bacterium]